MDMPDGFVLAAITRARGSARCVRVESLSRRSPSLPGGACVGTSSLRREAQLRERYPLLQVEAAARQRQHAAAQARRRPVRRDHPRRRGLEAARLGDAHRARCSIPTNSLPAPGQGALALECRADRADVIAALAPLADHGDARSRRPPSARSRARCRAAATRRSAAYAEWRGWRRCGCAVCSRAATAATCCAASASATSPTSPRREALGAGAGRRVPGARRGAPRCGVIAVDALAERAAQGRSRASASSSRVRRARPAAFAQQLAALGATPIIFPAIVDPAAGRSRAARRARTRRWRSTISRSSCPPMPSNTACRDATRGRPASRLRARARAPPRRSPPSASPTCAFPATTFDSEGLLALPALADVARQARRDLSRRRRPRASRRYAARARRDRRLRRLLSPRARRRRARQDSREALRDGARRMR